MNGTTSIILMIISSLLAAFGQISLKIGSMRLERKLSRIIKNFAFITGVFFYGFSAVLAIVALKGAELTVLYPIAALNYVWVSFLAIKYLKEEMNKYKWGGIALIIVGVSLIV